MITEVYDALVSAGADDGKPRRAAEVLANYEDRFDRLERKIDGLKVDLDQRTTELDHRIEAARGDLGARTDAVRSDLGARIDLVRSDLTGRINLLQWQLALLIGGVTAVILKLFL